MSSKSNDVFRDLFVFEMANNHQGSLDHGLRIVREMAALARRQGVRAAVKLQYRDLDTMIHPDYVERTDVPHIPRFMSTRLPEPAFRALIEAIREEGLVTMVTPFDEASVQTCLDHGVDIIKVASCSAADWPLLDRIGDTDLPVIISTGGLDLDGIDRVVSYYSHRHRLIALMHCVGMYPAPNEALHMGFISKMRRRYPGVEIGYSGHEAPDNLDPCQIAVAMGATFLERHVGVPTDSIQLNAYSSNPEQTETWVQAVLRARSIVADTNTKQVSATERDSLQSLKRGVYATRSIRAGEEIGMEDVFFAMPCAPDQLSSGEFGRYRCRYIASSDYAPQQAIKESAEQDDITALRSIVHDARGFLYEAGIEPGPDVDIEISHHYGIEEFRRVGAVLVNVINRSYCKKLIIVFPDQSHPHHAHAIKEETFQLLWGDLEVDIEGEKTRMQPGDLMLVEPGRFHGWHSQGGAVFEEISTTHIRSDSTYRDPAIQKKDPLERKTIVRNW
jgi:sialic acid synthase SpsE/quercetin dioxygenase-like cupin family protein